MVSVAQINHTLSTVRRLGMTPMELHVNPADFQHFADTEKQAIKRLSPWNRFRLYIIETVLKRLPTPEEVLRGVIVCGLPVVKNDLVPPGGMAIRMEHQKDDPNWLSQVMEPAEPEPPVEAAVAPAPASCELGDLQLTTLRRQDGSPTPTALLVKSMEGIDDIDNVIVIRVGKRGKIDMASTMPRVYAFGVLHATITNLMD